MRARIRGMPGTKRGCRVVARRVCCRGSQRGASKRGRRGSAPLTRKPGSRAVYLNGQSGACAPRQPQWQHWGALAFVGAASPVVALAEAGVEEGWVWAVQHMVVGGEWVRGAEVAAGDVRNDLNDLRRYAPLLTRWGRRRWVATGRRRGFIRGAAEGPGSRAARDWTGGASGGRIDG